MAVKYRNFEILICLYVGTLRVISNSLWIAWLELQGDLEISSVTTLYKHAADYKSLKLIII